jgi:mycothione reductase
VSSSGTPTPIEYDLIVIGTGSGNSLIGPEMEGWRIAIVERGVFGGTCINRGCVPTKMFVYPADLAEAARHGERLGVHTHFDGADWPAIVHRVFGRIDPISEGGRNYRDGLPNIDLYEGAAHFVGERELEVLGTRIRGAQVVLATGARSFIPDVPGLADVPFHTSDSIMRLGHQPRHLVIMGGGFIAAEFAHVFGALGTVVTVINRGHHLLRAEDDDIAARFTELAATRLDLVTGADIHHVRRTDDGVAIELTCDSGERVIEGDVLLVATGRVPNGDQLHAETAGIEVDARGAVVVDRYGRTTAPGVWALGDVNGRHQLKHMANGEAKVVRHNLSHPHDLREYDARPAPHAVFSHPQIGAVGLTEREARHRQEQTGAPYCVITHDYAGAAYGWAMEDTTSFCKLIGDPLTRRVIGAHVIGPQASLLVQLLVQGIHLGNTADEIVSQVWIHPALSEVVEQALLKLIDAFDASAAT